MNVRSKEISMDQSSDAVFNAPEWRPEGYHCISLVLQGGGALGAYQAGVYEALHEEKIELDWLSGVSIGAINAAIIAGNRRENRLIRLKEFWNRITERKVWNYTPDGDVFRVMRNSASAWMSTLFGVPGFFSPRQVNAWLAPAGAKDATSFYSVEPLKETLLELVDFGIINEKHTRLSLGAVNVRSGNFVYFDNSDIDIGPEHILASGALPPAFPMVQIGTDYYWDGGIVSNTPLQHLLAQETRRNMLVFQVDLFSSRGALPREMAEVMARHKDITYASRTRYNTDVYRLTRQWKSIAYKALCKIPESDLTPEEKRIKAELQHLAEVNICQLIYQQQAYEGNSKDYEFSKTSMLEHWRAGYTDTKRTLAHRGWMEISENAHGVMVHDVHLEREYSSL